MNMSYRRSVISLITAVTLALPVAQVAQAAGGPCDPPNFCPAGVVPFDGPNGPSGQSNPQPIQQAPAKSRPATSQPASAQTTTSANTAAGPSLKVSPAAAAPGDPILISGTNFASGGRIYNVFLNVRDANGSGFDTRSKEIKCVGTDDVVLIFLQTFGIGCSADAGGPIVHTDSNGNFRAAVTVPSGITPGAGQVCANDPDVYEACAPFTVATTSPVSPPRPNPPAPAPAPPSADPAVAQAIQQAIQTFDDTQSQAIAQQDASMMAGTVTADVAQSIVESTQQNLDDGVVGAQLQELDWGTVNVNGSTAEATDKETWIVTFADGTSGTQSNNWKFWLVLDNGSWKIQSMASQ